MTIFNLPHWIKAFNNWNTKPNTQFYRAKTDSLLWVIAKPEEFQNYEKPLNIWLYQRIEQDEWGKWIYIKETLLMTNDKIRRTERLFDKVNI